MYNFFCWTTGINSKTLNFFWGMKEKNNFGKPKNTGAFIMSKKPTYQISSKSDEVEKSTYPKKQVPSENFRSEKYI